MTATRRNTLMRSDTLLGVCEAIGQDFGVNPVIPRIGFGLLLFWNLGAAVGIYLALGAVILASRLIFPSQAAETPTVPVVVTGANDEGEPLARAA